jgi:benzylsuccinate CoA-transferase BbsF subunit
MARRYRPLRDVRVLAFESAFSLPAGTRTLADLGADVVRVGRPDPVSGPFITQVDGGRLNKRAVSINLASEAGRELTKRLVSVCDVVCNNFRPRVMRRFGLTYEELCQINPRIIVLQLSGYGGPGSWEDFPAYGPSVEAAGAMNSLIGEDGDMPMRVGSGVYADQTGGRYSALAIMAALEHRRRTGEGQFLDVSMYEGIVHLFGEQIMAAAYTGKPPERLGNRDKYAAPQGVYPCEGDDEWLAISVQTTEQWWALQKAVSDERLLDPGFDSVNERRRHHALLDEAITAWSKRQKKLDAAATLQSLAIPAAPVEKAEDLPFNLQLRARGAFQMVRHDRPKLGYMGHPHLTVPWAVAGRDRARLADARTDDADNVRVLKQWLGLSAADVRRLVHEEALLPTEASEIVVTRGMGGDPSFGERLALPRE